jgi:hypothetical protein
MTSVGNKLPISEGCTVEMYMEERKKQFVYVFHLPGVTLPKIRYESQVVLQLC